MADAAPSGTHVASLPVLQSADRAHVIELAAHQETPRLEMLGELGVGHVNIAATHSQYVHLDTSDILIDVAPYRLAHLAACPPSQC